MSIENYGENSLKLFILTYLLEIMVNLFVYGTLRDNKVQKEVIGRTVKSIKDCLKGYKKSTIKIEGEYYSALIPSSSFTLEGLVLSVNAEELKKIDEYETNAYKRKRIVLGGGKKAWVYLKA